MRSAEDAYVDETDIRMTAGSLSSTAFTTFTQPGEFWQLAKYFLTRLTVGNELPLVGLDCGEPCNKV
jgi:hypothetical protein